MLRWTAWSTDCSLLTTRDSTFTIFLRFLTPVKSATCSDSPRRRILTFWTSAQMRQEDWGQVARRVLACSWRSVSSHNSSLSVPGWPHICGNTSALPTLLCTLAYGSLRRRRGLVLVAYSEITFKWSQKNLLARRAASCGRSDSSAAARDSACKVGFPSNERSALGRYRPTRRIAIPGPPEVPHAEVRGGIALERIDRAVANPYRAPERRRVSRQTANPGTFLDLPTARPTP